MLHGYSPQGVAVVVVEVVGLLEPLGEVDLSSRPWVEVLENRIPARWLESWLVYVGVVQVGMVQVGAGVRGCAAICGNIHV